MSRYSEFVDFMRKEGAFHNREGIFLATMTGERACKVGDMPLMSEDLYIAEHLLNPCATKVKVTGEANTDNSTYLPPLKAGDTVIIYKVSESKYVIIERVVKA